MTTKREALKLRAVTCYFAASLYIIPLIVTAFRPETMPIWAFITMMILGFIILGFGYYWDKRAGRC